MSEDKHTQMLRRKIHSAQHPVVWHAHYVARCYSDHPISVSCSKNVRHDHRHTQHPEKNLEEMLEHAAPI
ncbi:hypothetical protein FIBSPDRAFT_855608, partial [Athelia psychrophila]